MPLRKDSRAGVIVRDPERTRRRILDAALEEFASCGYSGARVNVIARRARINKRMLYHYFVDKAGLFRAVLRHKIRERQASVEAQMSNADLASSLPIWFLQNCRDSDWVRLLAWESLQTDKEAVLDEKERRRLTRRSAAGIRKKQKSGLLRADVPAEYLQLVRISLTMFPMALPQLTRLIIGRPVHNPQFQREYARFLETISAAFRP